MFSVIFEVHPRSDQWDSYLSSAKMLGHIMTPRGFREVLRVLPTPSSEILRFAAALA
jgi:hypothetical protein